MVKVLFNGFLVMFIEVIGLMVNNTVKVCLNGKVDWYMKEILWMDFNKKMVLYIRQMRQENSLFQFIMEHGLKVNITE